MFVNASLLWSQVPTKSRAVQSSVRAAQVVSYAQLAKTVLLCRTVGTVCVLGTIPVELVLHAAADNTTVVLKDGATDVPQTKYPVKLTKEHVFLA